MYILIYDRILYILSYFKTALSMTSSQIHQAPRADTDNPATTAMAGSATAGSATPTVHAISGSVGSALALLLTYPLERARIELQSSARPTDRKRSRPPASRPSSPVPAGEGLGVWRCLSDLHRRGELYRGVVPIATTMAVSNYVFFYSLQLIRGLLASREGGPSGIGGAGGSRARSLLASSLAGIVNVIITNPLWVANLRIVQQRRSGDDGGDDGTGDDDDAREEPGLLTVMGRIGREEGVPGLWSGTLASLILVANPVLQFFAYEQVRLSLLGRRRRLERGGKPASLSPPEAFAVGAAAKTLATVVTYPVQLAQTLLRLPGEGGGDAGTLSCLARLYGEGGVAAWYSGMRAKLLQTVATASFMFLSYEQILAFMTGLAAGQVGGVGGG